MDIILKKKKSKNQNTPQLCPIIFQKEKGLEHACSCVPEEPACLRGVGHGSPNEVPMLPS